MEDSVTFVEQDPNFGYNQVLIVSSVSGTSYAKGNYVGSTNSYSSSAYPVDGVSGSYYYVRN